MPVTPLDLKHREFRRSFRGYNVQEVQDFLERVSTDYENSLTEIARLKAELETTRQRVAHYERLEETMQNALIVAQRTAEETKLAADKRAELIVAEAEHRRGQILEDASRRVAEVESQLGELHRKRHRFLTELRSLLRTHMELLENGGEQESKLPSASVQPLPQEAPYGSPDNGSEPDRFSSDQEGEAEALESQPAVEEEPAEIEPGIIDWSRVGGR